MSTTHSCVAELFTSQFLPVEHHDEESSMERGRRAQIEAWSLKRLATNLVRRMRGMPARALLPGQRLSAAAPVEHAREDQAGPGIACKARVGGSVELRHGASLICPVPSSNENRSRSGMAQT